MTSTTARVSSSTVQTFDVAHELAATVPLLIIAKALREIFAGQASFAPSLLSPNGR